MTESQSLNVILEKLAEIEKRYLEKPAYQSQDLKELAAAWAKAQAEYRPVEFNRENPYFKSSYADLDAILKAVRPALTKNGLSFTQQLRITDEGATVLHSILLHSSGQWMECRMRIVPPKNDAQAFGSTLSYAKRQCAMALLGVTPTSDKDDDDAEVAMIDSRDIMAKGTALNTKYDPRDVVQDTITKEQLDEMELELAEYPDIGMQVLEGLKLQSLADMPKSKYSLSMKRIREIKNMRNGVK